MRLMSQSVVPNWNHLKHQTQEQDDVEEAEKPSHVQSNHQNLPNPMLNSGVTELTLENRHLTIHGLDGLTRSTSGKPASNRAADTLESIVQQAAQPKRNSHPGNYDKTPGNITSVVTSSGGQWADNSSGEPSHMDMMKKRVRADSDSRRRNCSTSTREEHACSTSTMSCRDNDPTTMTRASFESPTSLKTKAIDEDYACRDTLDNSDDEEENKTEVTLSHSTRRSRSAAIHNQSERRRRDKINQKMKALQKLVPNSSKTDKASMLDEVIEYLKQLQAQLHVMSLRGLPQMAMPMGVQQQLQMAFMARMGMGLGMGMGMLGMNTAGRPAPQTMSPLLHSNPAAAFVPQRFVLPPLIPTHTSTPSTSDLTANPPIPPPDPYSAFLTQSMNMDLYNKMAALYCQQANQAVQSHGAVNPRNDESTI